MKLHQKWWLILKIELWRCILISAIKLATAFMTKKNKGWWFPFDPIELNKGWQSLIHFRVINESVSRAVESNSSNWVSLIPLQYNYYIISFWETVVLFIFTTWEKHLALELAQCYDNTSMAYLIWSDNDETCARRPHGDKRLRATLAPYASWVQEGMSTPALFITSCKGGLF